MGNGRKFTSEFKGRVALEAIKGTKTMAELSSEFEVHASQISKWKKQVMSGVPGIFSETHKKNLEIANNQTDKLYQQIGKLQVENEFLKKTVYQC